jgi:hypothetical protein
MEVCECLGIVYIMETPDERRFSNLWYARFHRERTVRKGRLVDSVVHALQGSISRTGRGSSILEGTVAMDHSIEKPLVTVNRRARHLRA